MNEERLIAVGYYESELEAELVKGLLANAGVQCLLSRHDASGMLPSMHASSQGGFTLLVHPRDLEAADKVIRAHQESRADGQGKPDSTKTISEQKPLHAISQDSSRDGYGLAWAAAVVCLIGGFFLGIWYQNVRWELDGEVVTDSNQDGRTDVWDVYVDGRRVSCSMDTDFDGRIDEWYEYDNRMMKSGKKDVNSDGKPDYSWTYREGVIFETIADVNLDGNPDQWERYVDGRLSEIRQDTDKDGNADLMEIYNNEMIVECHWRRAGSLATWKKVLYRDGVLDVELVDTDGNGTLDTRRKYDLYQEIIQIEKGVFD